MRDHLFVRGAALVAHRHQQARVEPSAILVVPFDVHAGGPRQVRPVPEHRGVRDARLEPDVDDVGLLGERRARATRADGPGGDEVARVTAPPGIGPLLAEDRRHQIETRRVEQRLPAAVALQRGDRHSPRALARDAPVRTMGEHVGHALLAPCRYPPHRTDRLEAGVTQAGAVHRDEPLHRGAKNHRILAPPAVRVLVGDSGTCEQHPLRVEQLDDVLVGVEHAPAREPLHLIGEASGLVHRRVDRQPVLHPREIVLVAVPGSGVHAAGAGVEGDVLGEDHDRLPVDERMSRLEPRETRRVHHGDGPRIRQSRGAHERVEKRLRHDEQLGLAARRTRLDHGIACVGSQRDRQVGGQRPGRRGPDRDRGPASREVGEHRPEIDGKAHGDRRGGVLGVLDLGLGQRGAAGRAPVNRLLSLVDGAAPYEAVELLHDGGLVLAVDRPVGGGPLPEHPEPAEILPLQVDVLLRVLAARLAHLQRAHAGFLRAELPVHLQLDRQPVAVPAGPVRCIESHHSARLYDEILEDLVEALPQVDPAVGVWRAVVQDEDRPSAAGASDPLVQPRLLPARQPARLGLRQIGLHAERGPWQVEGGLDLLGCHTGLQWGFDG